MRSFTPIALTTFLLVSLVASVPADTSAFKIVDDPALDKAVAEARAEFLKKRRYDRLDAVLLLPNADGSWRRGSYNPEAVSYPASCVKLAYLAAAMRWCRENNYPYEYLDRAVRPMITVSDNVQTGVVVDAITGAPNLPDLQSRTRDYDNWLVKRRYTERFLESRGLLDNQVLLHKTYPSNSGPEPVGAEQLARETLGGNLMQPKLAASLMLEIVKGAIEPGATDYMRGLLRHDRWSDYSVLGFGLPPGSINENKLGVAYDTVEDIQFARLPNGQEFILAVFTNGRDKTQPFPHDCSHLGLFCELIIERLDLNRGGYKPTRVDDGGPGFETVGEWTSGPNDVYQHGDSHLLAIGGSGTSGAAWNLALPDDGKYEVMAWYPEGKTFARDAPYTIYHAGGTTTVKVNQQIAGGRWVRLGDFEFKKGEGRVELWNRVANASQFVAADAIKATRWPDAATEGGETRAPGNRETGVDAGSVAATPKDAAGAPGSRETPDTPGNPAPTPVPPGTPISSRVEVSGLGIDAAKLPAERVATVAVRVRDNYNQRVEGAEVAGVFIGDVQETVKGVTGRDGIVIFTSRNITKKKINEGLVFTFYVESVVHPGLTYDPAASPRTRETCRIGP